MGHRNLRLTEHKLRTMHHIYICIIPKTKKFGCVGRGDLTFLFKSCEVDKSQGDLFSSVENNKSFTSRPSGL